MDCLARIHYHEDASIQTRKFSPTSLQASTIGWNTNREIRTITRKGYLQLDLCRHNTAQARPSGQSDLSNADNDEWADRWNTATFPASKWLDDITLNYLESQHRFT
jgi:hypothetical protein